MSAGGPRGSPGQVSPGRRRPPNRRLALRREVRFGDHAVTVAVGFDPDGARVLEVFAATPFKAGSELVALLEDGAVLLSRRLQYEGAATVAASLGREGHIVDPTAAAPSASILGLLARVALDVQTELDAAAGALAQAFAKPAAPDRNAHTEAPR